MNKILVVDDEKGLRVFLEILLKKEGYEVTTAKGGEEALGLLERSNFDLILSDIRMPKMNGIEFLARAKEIAPETEIIMITAYASIDSAIESMKLGAYDYIAKPFKNDELKLLIKGALEKKSLKDENILLKTEVKKGFDELNIVCRSPQMYHILELVSRVAQSSANILIIGESGTGKELIARTVHYQSPLGEAPFIPINCGGIPDNLLESELFGYRKGAFTGAYTNKKGILEIVNGGTLFLDEVADLPLPLQVKLLRVVQEKTFIPLGATSEIKVDFRIVSATNRDLDIEVKMGKFREDLFYRLNVIPISIPPLRERKEDIPLLAQYFLTKYCRETGKKIKRISFPAMEILLNYDFPGNVRELENSIERAATLESGSLILPESLNLPLRKKNQKEFLDFEIPPDGIELEEIVGSFEKNLIHKAMERSKGIKKGAAGILGLSPRSLRYRLEKYGIR